MIAHDAVKHASLGIQQLLPNTRMNLTALRAARYPAR